MTFIPLPQAEPGGQKKVWSSDDDVKNVLLEILIELQKMNVHLYSITDEQINYNDLKEY